MNMPYMEIGNPNRTKAPAENQAIKCGSVLSHKHKHDKNTIQCDNPKRNVFQIKREKKRNDLHVSRMKNVFVWRCRHASSLGYKEKHIVERL
jgi:hypothetical protein